MLAGETKPKGIALRREQTGDYPFLEALFTVSRWAEFDGAGWKDDFRRTFLAEQFSLQCRHYASAYAGAYFGIVEHDGLPIGRLYIFEGATDIRIVDISLVPELRGQGIGTALLKSVLAQARAKEKSVSIHVELNNPARHLYTRLGFVQVSVQGPYIYMECLAG